jgi:HD-GYP domain-containing protein (c-di-GMP phosphodiesterase class II)
VSEDKNTPMENSSTPSHKSVFIISTDNEFIYKIKNFLKEFPDFHYEIHNEVAKFLELPTESLSPYLFLIDGNLGQTNVTEWTQTLKMSFSKTPLIVFHSNKHPLNFEIIKKNGADHLIHINFDKEFIIDLLLDLIPYDFHGNNVPLAALSAISNKDLNSDLEINFDVFVHLPSNHKTILLRKKGSKLEETKIKKIEDSDQKVYFKKTEKKAFLEYARTAQTMSNAANPIALTEQSLKTKKLIFLIMSEFFDQEVTDFKAGKNIFERCKEIIQEYQLLDTFTPNESFHEILKYTGEYRTFYNDAINVCIFSAHIGNMVGLGKDKIESLALAGLLHNIGLSYLENYDLNDSPDKLSASEKGLYETYPDKSVLMIKGKKVPLPNDVSETILEHRENMDGSGFPKKKGADKIHNLSKIIRVAYELQVMTALSNDKSKQAPNAAIEEMKNKVLAAQLPLDLNTVLTLSKASK